MEKIILEELVKSSKQIKRGNKYAMAIIMAIALLCCNFFSVNCFADKISDLEAKINEIKGQKSQTESEINESKEELKGLNETATTLKGTLNTLNNELSNVSSNLADLEEKIKAKDQEISDITADLEEAVQIENEQYEAMKIRIRFMYEERDFAVMESLFGASSFSDFLNKSDYFESVAAYDRRMLTKYQETHRVVQEAKGVLESERSELEKLREEASSEHSRVSGLVNKTSDTISNYEDEIEATEQEMKEQEALLAQQQANINELQKQLAEEKRLSELANNSAWRDISQVNFVEGDRKLLANIIYCEAGNQSFAGQVGVGAVVMNRVMSSVFPDTVVGVIYQKNQFSPVKSGRLALALANDKATASCYMAADAAMQGQTTVGNCLFFRTPVAGITPKYQIEGHIFY